MRRVVVDNIGTLCTMDGTSPHGLGLVHNAVIVCKDGLIDHVGPKGSVGIPAHAEIVDAGGGVVVPGLIDCHTHALFVGDRCDEFARRARGESYTQIAAAGGGIRSTMRGVRAASVDDLVTATRPRLQQMLARGITTVEIKSGYGLSVDDELKMLRAIKTLQAEGPIHIEPTLLAAHAVPPEEASSSSWITRIIDELLPLVAAEKLATSCDVFVEQGAFSVDDAGRLLRAAEQLGLRSRVHAEQLSWQGGSLLAAEVNAISAGHLEHVTAEDAVALAAAGVVCEVLSIAQVFLRGQRAIPGRLLKDAGCVVAVATDMNPGTAMSSDLALAAGLAVTQCGLFAEEALHAITTGGAAALGLKDRGVIARGKRADLLVLNADNPLALVYRWGEDLTRAVVVDGRIARRVASL
ncbi:MAG: imidazolonepropionase [Deltaproteobacteria bacterium]|nr:imidazolonepropionase [Deltaproteobacteria bacterium]